MAIEKVSLFSSKSVGNVRFRGGLKSENYLVKFPQVKTVINQKGLSSFTALVSFIGTAILGMFGLSRTENLQKEIVDLRAENIELREALGRQMDRIEFNERKIKELKDELFKLNFNQGYIALEQSFLNMEIENKIENLQKDVESIKSK